MTVEGRGRHAGAALRERFDGTPAPPLPAGPHGSGTAPGHRTRRVLAGVAATLAVALAVGLLLRARATESAGSPGGTWERLDIASTFGRGAGVGQVVAGGPGFVALGSVRHAGAGVGCAPPCATGAIWTSTDGRTWRRVPPAALARATRSSLFSAAVHRGTIVVLTASGETLRSTDGRHWRRTGGIPAPPRWRVAWIWSGPRGFVVVADAGRGEPAWTYPVWTSADGTTWTAVSGTGTAEHPIGLPLGARLGHRRLTLGPSTLALGAPPVPAVFASDDGVHWTRLPATPPRRLALPLATSRDGRTVMGIQYEDPGTFGGRLWSTRDGVTWTEVTSFAAQMPVANPDHLTPAGRWWVLGGNRGTPDGNRRASMWTSPDLRHWFEMPARLRGPETQGGVVDLAHASGRVVGVAPGLAVWRWTPPE